MPPSVNPRKPGRGVPDVAADADPLTGYKVRVDGRERWSAAPAPSLPCMPA